MSDKNIGAASLVTSVDMSGLDAGLGAIGSKVQTGLDTITKPQAGGAGNFLSKLVGGGQASGVIKSITGVAGAFGPVGIAAGVAAAGVLIAFKAISSGVESVVVWVAQGMQSLGQLGIEAKRLGVSTQAL